MTTWVAKIWIQAPEVQICRSGFSLFLQPSDPQLSKGGFDI